MYLMMYRFSFHVRLFSFEKTEGDGQLIAVLKFLLNGGIEPAFGQVQRHTPDHPSHPPALNTVGVSELI